MLCLGWGEMNRWVNFCQRVMGFLLFKHFDDRDISTEYSALMSKVMTSGNERIRRSFGSRNLTGAPG